jgi:hypothetical protein
MLVSVGATGNCLYCGHGQARPLLTPCGQPYLLPGQFCPYTAILFFITSKYCAPPIQGDGEADINVIATPLSNSMYSTNGVYVISVIKLHYSALVQTTDNITLLCIDDACAKAARILRRQESLDILWENKVALKPLTFEPADPCSRIVQINNISAIDAKAAPFQADIFSNSHWLEN